MPDLLTTRHSAATRPAPPRDRRGAPPRPELRRRSRVLAGISAALAAASAGLLLVEAVALICWMAEPRSAAPLSAALRTGAAFWLLGNGGRLHLAAGTAALIPLGLSVLFAALAARAGAVVARVRPAGPRPRTLLACALAVGVPYGLIAALIAGISSGGGLATSVLTALTGAIVLGAGCAAIGAARELPTPSPQHTPMGAIAAGVAAAGALLIAVSALLAAVALVTHLSDAAALARPAKAGAVGGFGLLALQAALTPNVAAWTLAYLLGPGFAVGTGTLVSPTGMHLGDVPGLPMLAGLPSDALPWTMYVLFLAPPAAGMLAGLVIVRRLPGTPKLPVAALLGAGSAVAMGALAAALAALSGGPVTGGRLATIGPSAWQTAIAAALEVGLPCTAAVLGITWRQQCAQRRRRPAPAAVPEPAQPARRWQRLRPRRRLHRVVAAAASGGRGLGTGLGLDGLLRRLRSVRAQPVDLIKRAPARVSLTRGDDAGASRRPLRPRPSRRRKSKVSKLPD